jgi:hypothetical protein
MKAFDAKTHSPSIMALSSSMTGLSIGRRSTELQSLPEDQITDLVGVSTEERIFRSGIVNLLNANHHSSVANYNKSMLNVELLSYALCWFGMVSVFR